MAAKRSSSSHRTKAEGFKALNYIHNHVVIQKLKQTQFYAENQHENFLNFHSRRSSGTSFWIEPKLGITLKLSAPQPSMTGELDFANAKIPVGFASIPHKIHANHRVWISFQTADRMSKQDYLKKKRKKNFV